MELFKHLLWEKHQKHDDNFEGVNKEHKDSGGKSKATRPGAVGAIPYISS